MGEELRGSADQLVQVREARDWQNFAFFMKAGSLVLHKNGTWHLLFTLLQMGAINIFIISASSFFPVSAMTDDYEGLSS